MPSLAASHQASEKEVNADEAIEDPSSPYQPPIILV
jgi:hypothetical protein